MTGSLAGRILDDDRQFKTARLGEAGEQSRIKPNVGQFDVVVRSGRDAVDAQRSGWTTAGRPSIRTRTSESSCSEVFSTTTSRITGTAFSWYARLTYSVTEQVTVTMSCSCTPATGTSISTVMAQSNDW